jgi:single-strand DNA-binding protein
MLVATIALLPVRCRRAGDDSVASRPQSRSIRRESGDDPNGVPMNINRVVLTGNLTQDPDLRSLPSGAKVCALRIASNTRRKGADGHWEDKPNYFDVRVCGAQGEACARFLSRGRPIAVDGRLEWREFEAKEGQKRQAVEIVADSVEFLAAPSGERAPGPESSSEPPPPPDDIPF